MILLYNSSFKIAPRLLLATVFIWMSSTPPHKGISFSLHQDQCQSKAEHTEHCCSSAPKSQGEYNPTRLVSAMMWLWAAWFLPSNPVCLDVLWKWLASVSHGQSNIIYAVTQAAWHTAAPKPSDWLKANYITRDLNSALTNIACFQVVETRTQP